MNSPSRKSNGFVLIVVLVVLTILSLSGFTFSELMVAERDAVRIHGTQIQSRYTAASAIEYLQYLLTLDALSLEQSGGLHDNPGAFQGILVRDALDPRDRLKFSIIAPMDQLGIATGMVRFGLENESGRINLNLLLRYDEADPGSARGVLMFLPGMTEEIADSILDWMDEDDEPREFGVESDFYMSQATPYVAKNGPLDSVEELLMVNGVTPWHLFGSDADRNYIAEDTSGMAESLVTDTGDDNLVLTTGWINQLTIYSQETDVSLTGEEKINLNGNDLQTLYEDLQGVFGDEWATFIVAYRQSAKASNEAGNQTNVAPANGSGQSGGAPSGGAGQSTSGGGSGRGGQGTPAPSGGGQGQQQPASSTGSQSQPTTGSLDLTQPSKQNINSFLDLVGAQAQAQFEGSEEPVTLDSPFTDNPSAMGEYLARLWELTSLSSQQITPGRININQASRAVMLSIPGMDEQMVDNILDQRIAEPPVDDTSRQHPYWPLAEGLIEVEDMKRIEPFITIAGSVYRAQIVGYTDRNGPATRIEIVIDTTGDEPAVVFWKDLSHLGRGYTLQTLGAAASR